MATKEHARYWAGIAYPENMRDDWKECIGDILQVPYAYCVHDKDLQAGYTPKQAAEDYMRKEHVHIMIAYANTTTANAAMSLIAKLSAPGKSCISTIQSIANVRHMYNYLIHDTDSAREQHKYQYDVHERVTGNSFDIGLYEQVSVQDKQRMLSELCQDIIANNIMNFADVYAFVISNYDSVYIELVHTYSGLFERLARGLWHKYDTRQPRRYKYYQPDGVNPEGSNPEEQD